MNPKFSVIALFNLVRGYFKAAIRHLGVTTPDSMFSANKLHYCVLSANFRKIYDFWFYKD